jgi:hypothetical protein
MRKSIIRRPNVLRPTVAILFVLASLSLASHASSDKPSKPAKSAPAPKASTPAKSSSGVAGHSTTGSNSAHGATTTGHTGPTTSNPSGHTSPTTSNPSGRTSPTTGNAGGHAGTTSSTAGKTGSTSGSVSKTATPDVKTHTTATGRPAPATSRTIATNHGAVTKRANGKVSDVHDNQHNMNVHNGLNGSRRVSVERADHSRIVAERGRPGYIERRYDFHGHSYDRRAYYWHGHEYNRYYRGYYYHGAYLGVYAPAFYYGPGFYGWAYNPWYQPIGFAWGWGASPWYGFYGYYFAPYPVYAAPAEWLTDYMISTQLAAAYAAQQEAHTEAAAAASAGGQPMLTPEVKAQIADEVRAQIALENSESQQNAQGQEPDPQSSSINRMFSDGKPHVFVANSSLDVVDAGGNECALSDGDVLKLNAAPPDGATDARLNVISSKGGNECQRTAQVTVAVTDLQEMQNGMRETVDQGMKELQAKQGKDGIPAAPASAQAPPVESAFAQVAPPPEPDGEAAVKQQITMADQVDTDAAQASPIGALATSTSAPPAAATVNIALGQSIGDVTAALGQPLTVVDLGAKKIYKYKDMKVTFRGGKVVDVE